MAKLILFLAANPLATDRLRLSEEVREIENGLRRAKQRDNFVLEQKHALRAEDLRRAMLDYDPAIVHFSGHGVGGDGIVLQDNYDQPKVVSIEALQGFFKLFPVVECVVLNACYSEQQAKAISQNVKYVIGLPYEIEDRTAIEFSVSFYDAIGSGRTVEFAHQLACNSIQMYDVPEHLLPILIVNREVIEDLSQLHHEFYGEHFFKKPVASPTKPIPNLVAQQQQGCYLTFRNLSVSITLTAIMTAVILISLLNLSTNLTITLPETLPKPLATLRSFIDQRIPWRSTHNPKDSAMYVKIAASTFRMGTTQQELEQLKIEWDDMCKQTTKPKECENPQYIDQLDDELEQHEVYVDDFWIMQTEVTVAQYAQCVSDQQCTPPASGNTQWQNYIDFQTDGNFPITFINWSQALTYAQWAGGSLPTEAQWEKACRGIEGNIYAWGNNDAEPKLDNYRDFDSPSPAPLAEVMSYPKSANGLYEMSGNVREWTRSLSKKYPYNPEDDLKDPLLTQQENHIRRGGSRSHLIVEARCANRRPDQPDAATGAIGFRVVLADCSNCVAIKE